MSFAIVATVATAATVYSAYNANEARKDQKEAQKKAAIEARKQADLADQANNKASRKAPNIGDLFAANGAPGGVATTVMTGPQGVDRGSLLLGRNTLLGS